MYWLFPIVKLCLIGIAVWVTFKIVELLVKMDEKIVKVFEMDEEGLACLIVDLLFLSLIAIVIIYIAKIIFFNLLFTSIFG